MTAPTPPAAPVVPATPPATPATPPAPVVEPTVPVVPVVPPVVPPVEPPVVPPVVPPTPPVVEPAALTLTLPKDSVLGTDVVERTAAIASELGLSPDHAQRALDFFSQEAKATADKAVAAAIETHLPGGAAWEQQNTEWKAAALKDPDLGNGNPDQLAARSELGVRVLATFFPTETIEFLEKSGLASHPATLKGLVKIGQMMREDQLVMPSSTVPAAKKSAAETLYGGTKKES